jgi:hypothetical protein
MPSHEGEVAGPDPQSQESVTTGCFHCQRLAGSQICSIKKGVTISPMQMQICALSHIQITGKLCLEHGQTVPVRQNIQPPPALAQPWSPGECNHLNDASCISRLAYFVYCIHSSKQSTVATGPQLQPTQFDVCPLNADCFCQFILMMGKLLLASLASTDKLRLQFHFPSLFTLFSQEHN